MGVDLRALLGRQVGGRGIELVQQADYPEPCQQGTDGEHSLRWFVTTPCYRSVAELSGLEDSIKDMPATCSG